MQEEVERWAADYHTFYDSQTKQRVAEAISAPKSCAANLHNRRGLPEAEMKLPLLLESGSKPARLKRIAVILKQIGDALPASRSRMFIEQAIAGLPIRITWALSRPRWLLGSPPLADLMRELLSDGEWHSITRYSSEWGRRIPSQYLARRTDIDLGGTAHERYSKEDEARERLFTQTISELEKSGQIEHEQIGRAGHAETRYRLTAEGQRSLSSCAALPASL